MIKICLPELAISQKTRGRYESADGRFSFTRREVARDWFGRPTYNWTMLDERDQIATNHQDLRSAREFAAYLAAKEARA